MRGLRISRPLLALMLAACSGTAAREQLQSSGSRDAIVIRGDQMSGTVLQAIAINVPAARITTPSGQCPRIIFRGNVSMHNQPNPSIYIDGTQMADTCILNTLSSHDIERVEVYPSGNSPDATIRRNPAGVIAIYRRRE